MLFRTTNIRFLGILIVINILVYTIFLQWLFQAKSSSSTDGKKIHSSSLSKIIQPTSPPSIFKHAPMHDELVELLRPIR
jgi:hypothetical protein